MLIAVKEIGQPLKMVNTTEKYRTYAVKDILHGYVEFYRLSTHREGEVFSALTIGIDEDGVAKNYPINFEVPVDHEYMNQMIKSFKDLGIFVIGNIPEKEYIRGTAVFTRAIFNPFEDDFDYVIKDLTENDLDLIKSLF